MEIVPTYVARSVAPLAFLLFASVASAQTPGAIAGTVTDATGSPLFLARVTLYSAVGGFAPGDLTDAAGHFRIPDLAPGIYYAQASSEPSYPISAYGATCLGPCGSLTGTPIVVEPGLDTEVNFALTRAGSISGTITNADTGALEFGSVTVYDSSGFWVTYNNTQPLGGTYIINGLRPGRYYLRATNSSGDVNLGELYAGVVCDAGCDVTDGTLVDVASGATTSGIDFTLDLGGTFTGVVTSAASALPLPGVYVAAVNRRTGKTEFVLTGTDGTYRMSRLETGDYSVWTRSFATDADQMYGGLPYWCDDNAQDCSAVRRPSTPVAITAGSTTAGINFSLPAGAELRGTVRDDLGPLNGARLSVRAADGRILWVPTLTGSTFAVRRLPAGRYYLSANRQPTHASASYPSRDCGVSQCPPTLGDPIDVVAGQIVGGLEIRLRRLTGQSSISGRVSARATGAGLEAGVTVCSIECSSVATDSAGNFIVTGLGAGTYYVRTSWTAGGYADAWYGGTPVIGGDGRGSPVLVRNAEAVTGVEIRLDAAATIRGTLTFPSFWPQPSFRVFLYDARGGLVEEEFVSVSAGGRYEFTRLPAGSYYVRGFDLPGDSFSFVIDEVYDNVACASAACVLNGTPVAVAAGQVRDGIDFALEVGGWITGRALTKGNLGVDDGVTIEVYDSAGRLFTTAAGGRNFEISGLPTGTYFLKARAQGRSSIYQDLQCPACSPTAGTPIHVQAGRPTTGIEILVGHGALLSGRVRDATTGLPLSSVGLLLTDADGGVVRRTDTDLNGIYEMDDVGPGRFYLRTFNSLGYVDEIYDDRLCSSCDGLTGTPIDMNGVDPVSGVDLALLRGGWVSGRVTDANGAPLSGVGVSFYSIAGTRIQRAQAAVDGVLCRHAARRRAIRTVRRPRRVWRRHISEHRV